MATGGIKLYSHFRPYADPADNVLGETSSYIIFGLVFTALLSQAGVVVTTDSFSLLLFLGNVLLFMTVFSVIVNQFRQLFQDLQVGKE